MDDTLPNKAVELGKLLEDHKGLKVVVMDMRALNFWTDFFVIATVTSDTHLFGLERHVKDYVNESGMEILRRSRKPEKQTESCPEEWRLLDLGGIVIHLMTEKARGFFELERLWSAAPLIFQSSVSEDHSSKSS